MADADAFCKARTSRVHEFEKLKDQEQSQRIILRYLKLIIYIRLEIRTKILTPKVMRTQLWRCLAALRQSLSVATRKLPTSKVTRNLLLSITKNAVVPIQMIEPQIRQLPNQKVQFPLNIRDGSHVFKC